MAVISPARRIDLRAAFKLPAANVPWGGKWDSSVGRQVESLAAFDNERFVVALVTKTAGNPALISGTASRGSPYTVETLTVAAATGSVAPLIELPAGSGDGVIVATGDYGAILQVGTRLVQVTSQGQTARQYNLPAMAGGTHENGWLWEHYPSPCGNRLLLIGGSPWSDRYWLWFDAQRLLVLDNWRETRNGIVSIGERRIAIEPWIDSNYPPPPAPLMVRLPGSKWKTIPATLGKVRPRFAAPKRLYFESSPNAPDSPGVSAFLLSLDSLQLRLVIPSNQAWTLGSPARARNGKRFVVFETILKGDHPVFDISGYWELKGLIVYDSPFHNPSYRIRVKGATLKHAANVALSSDGRYLAMMDSPDPVLEIYELPPPKLDLVGALSTLLIS